MRKTKAVSLLLSLALLASLAIPGTLALSAQAEGEQGNNGMVISKNATANDDGTYTITLEAYATGNKIITETKKDIPTDIVLVLDQSGSMAENMSSYDFRAYTDRDNSYFYNRRHNGAREPNLYYPLGDGAYATVSVTFQGGETYTAVPAVWNNYDSNWGDTSNYYSNRNNLYALVDGEYQKVTVVETASGEWWNPGTIYTYTYTLPDGTEIAKSERRATVPEFGTYGPLYVRGVDETQRVYTYTYTDAEGVTQTIGTSTGTNAQPDFTLYERYQSGSTSRLAALSSAVTSFANNVAAKAAGKDGTLGTGDDVNHRVAVVGFASKDGYGNNTELLSISGSNSGNVGVEYDSITNQNLVDVLQDMDTTVGQGLVQSAINALAAEGATQADLGMDMAKRILNANPVAENEKRARVVVFFTDGSPTSFSAYDENVANAAIANADSIKAGGADVYSVGVFPGADATDDGIADGNGSQRENVFMQNVSSNNGTPRSPSYYLSASDADTLSSIFQQISDNIETGGSSTTLSEETVIKDIIAPEFTLPDGADASNITLETYSYTGENHWAKNDTAMGATASVNGDQVDVTGFDFAENYVGTVTENGNVTYRGDKLVITFSVEPKAGFLGGNNIYTNTSAGVYENGTAESPVMEFERPQVNVPIKDVTVTAEDKNVYLLNDVTAEELRSGATVKVGNVELSLDPDAVNYGLEAWQNAYVDISVVITDAEGNVVSPDLTDLRDDTTYTVEVQVSPKETALSTSDGTPATAKSDDDEANINVFKPELTYQDSEVYYGADAPTDFTANLTDTKWKHENTEADTATMGAAPELTLDYTVDATKIEGGKINTKQDVGVDAAVKIGETDVTADTTFLHAACAGTDCSWDITEPDGTPAFLLHVKTCQLTISKTGGASDEPYVFTVKKDGKKYSEITIVGNASGTIYELPLGTYTIEEDTGWSWRFSADNGGSAELTAENPTGSITCTNTQNKHYWLNGFSNVVKNIFDINKN